MQSRGEQSDSAAVRKFLDVSPVSDVEAVDEDWCLIPSLSEQDARSNQKIEGNQKPREASGSSCFIQRGEAGESAKIEDWDISAGPLKVGPMQRLSMLPPMAARVVTNLVGGTLATTGYAAGKLGEAVGAGKAIDSKVFHAGITSFMWSNGIFPSVKHEPLGASGEHLSRWYGSDKQANSKDMALTPIIVSNHTSYLDGPILAAVFGAPKIVAKSGAKKVPVVGRLMEEMDVVFVDREDGDSRRVTLEAMSEHSEAWRPGDRPLLVFPEGTVSNGEGLLPFKKGSFASGAPVRPVIIAYTGNFDPACTTYRMSTDGPVETSDTEWAKQFMGHYIHSVHVRVLPPYLPNEAERADPALYAQNCRDLMAAAQVRVKDELRRTSWKEAAGRSEGGLGYNFGDVGRIMLRNVTNVLDAASCVGTRKKGKDPFLPC